MGLCAVIYLPSFIKIGSGVQKLIRRILRHTHTHGQQRDLISLLYFFETRKIGYKWRTSRRNSLHDESDISEVMDIEKEEIREDQKRITY
jgi:hypothetical protein